MKVALEIGEVLDIALLEGERVIGTLSLELKGLAGSTRVGRPALASARENKAAAAGVEGSGRRRKRKPMSAESRARMAEAQKRRWEKNKANEGSESND